MLGWIVSPSPIARFCPHCESRLRDDPQAECVFCAILDAHEIEFEATRHLAWRRPPRTGYSDDDGVFHPAPNWVSFDAHADGCARCRCERNKPRASGYIGGRELDDRSVHLAAARRAIIGMRQPLQTTGVIAVRSDTPYADGPVKLPIAGTGTPRNG